MISLAHPARARAAAFVFAWAAVAGPAAFAQESPQIELRSTDAEGQVFVVSGLNKEWLAVLERQRRAGTLSSVFSVHAGAEPDDARPAMLGETRLEGETLRFVPRFPLEPGVTYRAALRWDVARASDSPRSVVNLFALDKPTAERAVVAHVYPSRDVLPENQLKFYLHFSRPMSRGDAYRHVALLDAEGRPVAHPFLELGEELWDQSGMRFTLFFDPGRIKRGLKPREEVGPALEEGKSYTLVVRASWQDADGQPLAAEFRKPFRVVAPDDDQPLVERWRLTPPAPQTRQPMEVRFPESLDHGMLQRVLWIVDASGNRVPGAVDVAEQETRWRFTPERPWAAGEYRLMVDSALEDLAGNSIRRPFEVDVTRPVQRQEVIETVSLPFAVR